LAAGEHRRVLGRVAAIVVVVLAVTESAALAARPVAGGHFRFDAKVGPIVQGSRQYVSVDLVVTNDGRELATPSYVEWRLKCGAGPSGSIEGGFGALDGRNAPFRSVPIGADGRFSFTGDLQPGSVDLITISGAFERGGRVAFGSVVIGGDPSCRPINLPCRARLVGRPHAPHAGRHSLCDRVTIDYPEHLDADEAYRVYDRGVGCTTAREIARQWHASPTCQRLKTGDSCGLHGASCRAVKGRHFNRLVSARCRARGHPHGITELVYYKPCPGPKIGGDDSVSMWAINLDCHTATTFPVAALIGGPEQQTDPPCGDYPGIIHGRGNACTSVAGFVCRARSAALARASSSTSRPRAGSDPAASGSSVIVLVDSA
jgi:hypothetical protein